jgi:hypothetical protein
MPTPVAGYSGTPLPKKLGLKEGGTMVLLNAPVGIEKIIVPLPHGAKLVSKLAGTNELVVLFCKDVATLKKSLFATSKKLNADGSLWISWPKKTSKLFVDLTEDGIRAVALPTGLVDVKVCAVNEDWSGLKLMVRKELRGQWNA